MANMDQVVRGLEMHGRGVFCQRNDSLCPYWEEPKCVSSLCRDALELVNAQAEEIRKLKDKYDIPLGRWERHYSRPRVDADE